VRGEVPVFAHSCLDYILGIVRKQAWKTLESTGQDACSDARISSVDSNYTDNRRHYRYSASRIVSDLPSLQVNTHKKIDRPPHTRF